VLGYRWRPRFDYGRATFDWEFYGGMKDSRYVRRSTGQLARTPEDPTGIDITDRFDATWSGFFTAGEIPISEEADFVYDLYVENKQYQEMVATTLSNLNYQQMELDIGFEKRIWPRVNLITMIGGGFRYYEDRRAKDLDGDDILNTDLEYTFLEIENELEYSITNRWKWQIGMDIDQRKDNEDGYYDTTEGQVYMRFRYRNRDIVDFMLYVSYFKREFDNIEVDPAMNIDEEDLREREGYRGILELERAIFERSNFNIDLILGAEVWSFENSDPVFTYDRNKVYAGIRWYP